nr:response regulator [Bacteroidales bacterium]
FSSYAAILVTVLSFFNYPLFLYSLFSAVFLCFVVVVSEIYASIIILKKNYKPAWYFIFAFIFMAAGVILYIMRDTGILDDNIWTYNGTKIGLVTQSLILSFAVLDRFRRITRDANRLLANQKNKIEEQKNILEKAILELKKLSLVASKTDNCIAIFDKNGDLEWVNSAFTKLYGFTLEELIKIKGINIIKNSNHPDIESILNDCTANKVSISFQSSGQNKNKEIIWSQSTLSPILNEDDSIEKYIIIETDISLLKKYENDLIKAKEKAEQSDKLKTAFLSNMSHEIRTPMNAILGFANLLDDHDLTDKEKTYFVDLINKNSKNLLHLIDDILDIAKIEAGEIKITQAPCLLNSLFFEILSSFKSDKNLNNNIELLFNFDNNDPDFNIITDSFRLRQIITNLITNAFKFTEKGFIETGYQIKNSEILFYVKDTGIGIPDDKKELIFQRFIKVDHSNKSKLYGGTGIGLSICKNLIDLLNGKIWVESQLNQGSIFYFTLPYNNIQNKNFYQPETNNIIITNTIDWSNKTILIAEDELSNYELAREMLRKTKVNIIWAKDGQSAINLYKQNQSKINLILMDIKMPELDGYEATKIIKSINQDIKIIALTAYALSGEKEISMKAGCNDYITKPINQKKLLQKIKFFFDLT